MVRVKFIWPILLPVIRIKTGQNEKHHLRSQICSGEVAASCKFVERALKNIQLSHCLKQVCFCVIPSKIKCQRPLDFLLKHVPNQCSPNSLWSAI